MQPKENNPESFPHLNHGALAEYASMWAMEYPSIERITLHLNSSSGGRALPPRYVLVMEIKEDDRDGAWNRFLPDDFRFIVDDRFATTVLKPNYLAAIEGTPGLEWYDEWMFFPISPGEEHFFSSSCWTLFEKGPQAGYRTKTNDTIDEWQSIAGTALSEVEMLHNLTRQGIEDGLCNTTNLEHIFEREAYRQWDLGTWQHIKETHLDINYMFAAGKEKRDFKTRVIQRLLTEYGFNVSLEHIRKIL